MSWAFDQSDELSVLRAKIAVLDFQLEAIKAISSELQSDCDALESNHKAQDEALTTIYRIFGGVLAEGDTVANFDPQIVVRKAYEAQKDAKRFECYVCGECSGDSTARDRIIDLELRIIAGDRPTLDEWREAVDYAISHQNSRCLITHNQCGTDTWAIGRPCKCANCQQYLRDHPDDRFPVAQFEGLQSK